MPQRRKYQDGAERQRAYRDRKRNANEPNVTGGTQDDLPVDWPSVDDLLVDGASTGSVIDAISFYFTPDSFLEFAKALTEAAERRRYPSLYAAIDAGRAAKRNKKRNK